MKSWKQQSWPSLQVITKNGTTVHRETEEELRNPYENLSVTTLTTNSINEWGYTKLNLKGIWEKNFIKIMVLMIIKVFTSKMDSIIEPNFN